MAIACLNGDGVGTDTAKAVEVCMRTADCGCLYAKQSLGSCYFGGDEVAVLSLWRRLF
jgi:hypothetical protein